MNGRERRMLSSQSGVLGCLLVALRFIPDLLYFILYTRKLDFCKLQFLDSFAK